MSAIDTIRNYDNRAGSVPSGLWRLVLVTVGLVDRMAERRRSRLALLDLNDEQLKDIGISRAEAWREGTRPFWD